MLCSRLQGYCGGGALGAVSSRIVVEHLRILMLITPEIVSTELQERAGRDPVLSSRYGRMYQL